MHARGMLQGPLEDSDPQMFSGGVYIDLYTFQRVL